MTAVVIHNTDLFIKWIILLYLSILILMVGWRYVVKSIYQKR